VQGHRSSDTPAAAVAAVAGVPGSGWPSRWSTWCSRRRRCWPGRRLRC
jgi:hypothetical protein